MLGNLFHAVAPVLGPILVTLKGAALLALPLLARSIASGIHDDRRRELLREIAQGAVAAALLRYPGAQQDNLVREIVQLIMSNNPPTTNESAVRRAVESAMATAKVNAVNAAGLPHPGV